MTRRVRAPGALAEQRGRGKGEAAFHPAREGKRGLRNRLLSSRGSSNGRTPAPTSEEMSVRIRRPEQPNQWGRAVEAARPRIKTPGLGPEAVTTLANIAVYKLFF